MRDLSGVAEPAAPKKPLYIRGYKSLLFSEKKEEIKECLFHQKFQTASLCTRLFDVRSGSLIPYEINGYFSKLNQ